jgi:hypothetical protein
VVIAPSVQNRATGAWHTTCLSVLVVRWLAVVIGVAACAPPQRLVAVRLPELAPSREETMSWLDRTVSLRTTLGRAGIALTTSGIETTLESQECTTGPERRCVRCDLLDEHDGLSDSTLEELVAAFARYPVALLDAAGIERVALCRDLEHRGKQPAGLADTEARVLYVNVQSLLDRGRSGYSIDDIAETAHHEVYHLFDIPAGTRTSDLEWEQLNAHGFAYGTGRGEPTDPRPFGFVNAYAATTADEDRASTFQFLMVRGEELCALAKDDPTLLAKARVVWKRVAAVADPGFLRTGVSCAAALEH